MRAPVSRGASGFTLLEVMVALAILAASLVVLLQVATNNVRATHHARFITQGTFLARARIVQMETDLFEKGFGDIDEFESGTFDEQGYPHFRWESMTEKIELPADAAMKTQQAASDTTTAAKDPMGAMTGMIGGMMSMFVEPIRVGLEASIRRVTTRVFWDEVGRPEQFVEIVTFMTDPAKLDLAMGGGLPTGTAGTPTGTGTGTGTPAASTVGPGVGGGSRR